MPFNVPIVTNRKVTHCNTAFTPVSTSYGSSLRWLPRNCVLSASPLPSGTEARDVEPPTLRCSECIFGLPDTASGS